MPAAVSLRMAGGTGFAAVAFMITLQPLLFSKFTLAIILTGTLHGLFLLKRVFQEEPEATLTLSLAFLKSKICAIRCKTLPLTI